MIEEKFHESTAGGKGQVAVFYDGTDQDLRADRRSHERSFVRKCLEKLIGESNLEIAHTELGAPYIQRLPHLELSLSHSKNWYAIQTSQKKNVGIDIQVIRKEGLFNGRSYFVNLREEELLQLTDLNLHLVWSAKEAIYKYRKGKVENYKESMTVLEIAKNILLVDLDGEQVQCAFQVEKEYVLVYTC
jgi:phosphopantetheinyl transferase